MRVDWSLAILYCGIIKLSEHKKMEQNYDMHHSSCAKAKTSP